MNRLLSYLVVILGLIAIGAGLYLWLQPRDDAPVATITPPAGHSDALAEQEELPPPPAEPQPEIQHPIEQPPAPDPALAEAPDIGVAMSRLVGREALLALFNLDRFVYRAVATIDNLARPHAAPALWPVNPTPGRFATEGAAPGERIAAANYARYRAFVTAVTRVDSAQAVALYRQLYPQFQQAYEELGYPRGYFNDRLVAVIDHLLATPEPGEPVAVVLPEVKGPHEMRRPWVRYEYADASLEALSSGQRMLLRMGPENRKALKAKLAEIRRLLVRDAPRN